MKELAWLITFDFCVIVVLITVNFIILQETLRKFYKKLSGDSQQIKTAQRADKKRDKKILKKIDDDVI